MSEMADWVKETIKQLKEDNPNYLEEQEQLHEEYERNVPRFEEDTVLAVPFKELIWFKSVCDCYMIDRRFDKENKVWIVPKGTAKFHFERWIPNSES